MLIMSNNFGSALDIIKLLQLQYVMAKQDMLDMVLDQCYVLNWYNICTYYCKTYRWR